MDHKYIIKKIDQIIDQKPKVCLILGSGLSDFCNQLKNQKKINFSDINYFKKNKIEGKLTISLRVKQGEIKTVRFISETIDNRKFEECIDTEVRTWVLPKSCSDEISTSFLFRVK